MSRTQRKYDQEYKIQAVKLAKEIGGAKAAKELGIPEGTIHTWLKAVRAGTLLFWNHLLFCHRSRNRWNFIHKIWFTYHMGFLRLFIDQF